MKKQLKVLALMLGAAGLATSAAQAQDKVKIGFITDMSSLYADVEGKNGAVAIQMAIDDFGGKVLGMPIELLTADHQNKADIAASKAREWIDTQGLTMLFGVDPASAVPTSSGDRCSSESVSPQISKARWISFSSWRAFPGQGCARSRSIRPRLPP